MQDDGDECDTAFCAGLHLFVQHRQKIVDVLAKLGPLRKALLQLIHRIVPPPPSVLW